MREEPKFRKRFATAARGDVFASASTTLDGSRTPETGHETLAERGATIVVFVELAALQAGLLSAPDSVATSLASLPSASVADLRQLYPAVATYLAAATAPPTISLHLDELVNAVDTVTLLCRAN